MSEKEKTLGETKIRQIVRDELASTNTEINDAGTSRRSYLKLLGAATGGLLAGQGSRELTGGFVDTSRAASSGGSLVNIGELRGPMTGGASLTNVPGNGLEIDTSGNLNVENTAFQMVKSDAIFFQTFFESLDGFRTITNGSGTLNLNGYHLALETGSTSGSSAFVEKPYNRTIADPTFDKDRVFRTGVNFRDSTSNRLDYVAVGDPYGGRSGFGFKLTGGDLLGIVNDGTTETTTTLISGVSTGERGLRAELTAGTKVEFYSDGSKLGEITSGLPSGKEHAATVLQLYTENSSSSTHRLECSEFRMAESL